uniref:Uncharacterized protein n=1 Tax=Arundo donax TaxID=35708 RepID=A0A0A9BZ17_ARUDO
MIQTQQTAACLSFLSELRSARNFAKTQAMQVFAKHG